MGPKTVSLDSGMYLKAKASTSRLQNNFEYFILTNGISSVIMVLIVSDRYSNMKPNFWNHNSIPMFTIKQSQLLSPPPSVRVKYFKDLWSTDECAVQTAYTVSHSKCCLYWVKYPSDYSCQVITKQLNWETMLVVIQLTGSCLLSDNNPVAFTCHGCWTNDHEKIWFWQQNTACVHFLACTIWVDYSLVISASLKQIIMYVGEYSVAIKTD